MEPLKSALDASVVAGIQADLLRFGLPESACEAFARRSLAGLSDLELLERGRHIGAALRSVLPADDRAALDAIVSLLGPELSSSEQFGMAPFRYLPHVSLIGELGPRHPDEGLLACREITKRFTAEWCVRPLLVAHPDLVFRSLSVWATDPNVHVRRLVSEGTRPRLPWASRIPWQPRYLELLEALKDDPTEYVRRSVANHLGDVAKDDVELVVACAGRWLAEADEEVRGQRTRLVKHALRHPIKLGHPGALSLLGFSAESPVVVEGLRLSPASAELCVGDALSYTFEVINPSEQPVEIVVDVAVGYRKARGTLSPKVFKLAALSLGPNERRALSGTLSMRDLSTRRHYPGEHTLAVQINGRRHPPVCFTLLAR